MILDYEKENWIIKWTEYLNDSYIYGSQISFLGNGEVEFHNDLVPSGTILKQWFSKTNYQLNRLEPTLPIIDSENYYRIDINLEELSQGEIPGLLVCMIFYSREKAEISRLFIREKSKEFTCPKGTYSYEIQLVNTGNAHFHFHNFVISRIEKAQDVK